MTIVSQPRDNDLFREELWETADGFFGMRTYRVRTDIVELALAKDKIPKIGSSWSDSSPELKACVVVKRGPARRLGGKDEHADYGEAGGRCGWSAVPVEYATPGEGSFRIAPDWRSWTELTTQQDTATIYYPISRTSNYNEAPLTPIRNGDGATVTVGRLSVKVTAFYDPAFLLPLARWIALMRPSKVNADVLRLPRIYGTTSYFDIPPRSAKYMGFSDPAIEQQHLRVEHHFELAETWDEIWQPENAKGEALPGKIITDTIYEAADMSGLWPT